MPTKLKLTQTINLSTITGLVAPYYSVSDSVNNAIWVSSRVTNNLYRFDKTTKALIATINLGYLDPIGIDVDAGGFVWVACESDDNKVVKVNPADNSVVVAVTAGTHPYGVHCVGSFVYVTNGGDDPINNGTVSKIHRINHTVDATIIVGKAPHGMADDGTYLYCCNEVSSSISKINMATDVVDDTWSMGGVLVAVLPFWDSVNSRLWVTSYGSNIVKIFNPSGSIVGSISLQTPMGIDSNGTSVFIVSTNDKKLYRFNKATFAKEQAIDISTTMARGICWTGTDFFVCGYETNIIDVINTSNFYIDSAEGRNIVINNGQPSKTNEGIYFDDASCLNVSSFNELFTDYTFSFFYTPKGTIAERIISFYEDNNNRGYLYINSDEFGIYFKKNGTDVYQAWATASVVVNVKSHFEIGRQGNVIYLFKEGILLNTVTITASTPQYNNGLYLGADFYNGNINAASHGILHTLEINNGECLHTANFDPYNTPTAPICPVTQQPCQCCPLGV